MNNFDASEPSPAEWLETLEKVQAEVARDRRLPRLPRPAADRKPRRFGKLLVALMALAVILAVVLGPGILGSLLDRLDYARSVHGDRSRIVHGVQPQVKRRAVLVLRNGNGESVRVLADEAALGEFVRDEFQRLQRARARTHAHVRSSLTSRAAPVFTAMRGRVPEFADWYYAWPTSYRLTGKAMYSAAAHVVRPGVMGLDDAVAYDLERYVEKRYHDIVQRPEISDPLLQWAYVHAFEAGHGEFQTALAGFDQRFRRFVASHTDYLESREDGDDISITLDWDHQAKKLSVTGFERGAVESARGVALAAAGAMVGRRAGAAVGRQVSRAITRRVAAGTARGLATRLAGPFVARGLGTATATAVGASGGPVGALAGGAVGLGIDYAINEGIEYAERPRLETRMVEAVTLQERQWQEAMHASLGEAVDVWFDDLAEMLAAYRSR
jgi:hypothetical protein